MNRSGSLKYESTAMIDKALSELGKAKEVEKSKCGEDELEIVFTSTPHRFLKDYAEHDVCENFLMKTKQTPLVFPEKSFESSGELSNWLGQFSQGKGSLGKELYRRCPGKCSPQFRYSIRKASDDISIKPTVVCGHARDKSDNMYALSYALSCENPS